MIALTGATGFVGSTLLPRLLASGEPVRALARRAEALRQVEVRGTGFEIVEGDVADEASATRLLRGANSLVHLAAAVSRGRSNREEVYRSNVVGAACLARACRREGVRRVVLASTQVVRLEETGDYARTKGAAECVFLDAGLPVTILRLNMVYGAGSAGLFPRLVALVRGAPVVPVIGDGSTVVRPVLVDDVAAVIEACLRREVPQRVYDVGGPDALRFEEFLVEIMRAVGRTRTRVHLPLRAARLLARLGEALLPQPPLTLDNVSYFVPWPPCPVGPLRRDLGVALTPLRAGLRRVLGAAPEPA